MVWSAIGGAIGGWISPTQVEGPRIGDSANQSSAEGQPITWVLGTCGWVEGNIVDKSEIREVEKTDDGKGSGVETVTYEAHQDYCIMICESSEIRDSLMVGVLIVQVDGKIVYDMRPESDFGADNAKFLENHTFYDGNEAQLPDPTMEALPHNGVGNTPYYRGVFTMVARDINLTQYGERIPVYRFVMVGEGESDSQTVTSLLPGDLSRFTNFRDPRVDNSEDYSYQGFIGTKGITVSYTGDSVEEVIGYFTEYDYSGVGGGSRNPNILLGYSASTTGFTNPSIGLLIEDFGVSNVVVQPDVTDNETVVMVFNDNTPTIFKDQLLLDDACDYTADGVYVQSQRGEVATRFASDPGGQYNLDETCAGSGYIYGLFPLCIRVTRKVRGFEPEMGDPCASGEPTLVPDAPGFVQDCDGNVFPTPEYTPVTGTYRVLQDNETATIDGRVQFVKYALGPLLEVGGPDDTEAFWEAAYNAAVSRGEMPSGQLYGYDYPVLRSSAIEATYTADSIDSQALGLDTILTRIAIRGGLSAGDIDVTEMDQQVMGYMITQNYIGTDCIRPLMTAFVSYASEYDAKIRFHKHGEVAEMVIDAQDIIQGTEESDQTTREQAVEFPKTYSITYIDPTQNYTARPQVDRRTSSDVRAIGHLQTQVPVVLPPDEARQLANIGMKVNWARAMGSREFSVPYAGYDTYLELVAGKPFGMDSQRRIASEISLEDGEIKLKGLYDRQSAYTSDITATPAPAPTPPPSNIGGVTLFAAMNLPRLRTQDNTPGMYIAVAGLLQGWPGALIQMSSDDGTTWTTAIPSATQQSTMGYLTASITDEPGETIYVSVNGGELNSITEDQLITGGNPSAITTDGVSEVVQFQTATETDPGEYELTTLIRGGLGTPPASHFAGDRFVQLEDVYFLPLDITLAGRTLLFRPVTFGTIPDNNAIYSVVFNPLFTGPQVIEAYVNESDEIYVNENGSTYFRIEP